MENNNVTAITSDVVDKLKNVYDSNRETLDTMRQHIAENGSLDNGITDIEDTFEQGYNNALEYVFKTLNITF